MCICLFVYRFVFFCSNHCGTPSESFSENLVTIQLDLPEILRIRKLDWLDGDKERGRRRGGILHCKGLIKVSEAISNHWGIDGVI